MVDHVEQGVNAPARARDDSRASGRFAERAWEWCLEHALLFPIVALFLGTIVSSLPHELVSDSWFAIFGGHEIAHHGLPGTDNIAVWSHGRHWVDQQWLGQLLLYGLYAAGGVKLALLGHAAAVGSAFMLAIAFARWRGASIRAICWLALPAIFLLIWGGWAARAQSFAFALFVGVVWLPAHPRAGSSSSSPSSCSGPTSTAPPRQVRCWSSWPASPTASSDVGDRGERGCHALRFFASCRSPASSHRPMR